MVKYHDEIRTISNPDMMQTRCMRVSSIISVNNVYLLVIKLAVCEQKYPTLSSEILVVWFRRRAIIPILVFKIRICGKEKVKTRRYEHISSLVHVTA